MRLWSLRWLLIPALLLLILFSGCASARPATVVYEYVIDYSSGERRTLAFDHPGEVQGCFLVLKSEAFRVFIPGSWVTRIIEWKDGQGQPVDPGRTKTLK